MKRTAIYVRVSTQEQKNHGLSVDNQILALQDYCKDNGLTIVDIYNDAGISARKRYTRRPALLRLLEDCRAKKIDLIIFTKLDRWFRSVGDYYEVQRILDDCKVPWKAIWEDYDTVTSSGIFKVNIMLSVAQSEADRTSDRIKSTMAYKKSRGDYVGSAPIGYKVQGRDLIIDSDAKEGMEAFFETYMSTLSLAAAVNRADEFGLHLSRNHMCKLIKNPVYCGQTSQGYKCEAYISKEDHDLIVETMKQRDRSPKDSNRTYIFSGLCLCGNCGKRMSGKTVKRIHSDGTTVFYKKYVCENTKNMQYKCPHLQIVEGTLEQYLLDQLDGILAGRKAEIESINARADRLTGYKRKAELEAKLKRLANLYADGDIDLDAYRSKRDAIKEEISSIVFEEIEIPALPTEWKDIYNDLDEQHRKAFWKRILKSITLTVDTKAHPKIEFL